MAEIQDASILENLLTGVVGDSAVCRETWCNSGMCQGDRVCENDANSVLACFCVVPTGGLVVQLEIGWKEWPQGANVGKVPGGGM